MVEQHLANLSLIMEHNNQRGMKKKKKTEAASQRQEERIKTHLGTLSLQPGNDFLSLLLPVEFDWRLFEEIFLFFSIIPSFFLFLPKEPCSNQKLNMRNRFHPN